MLGEAMQQIGILEVLVLVGVLLQLAAPAVIVGLLLYFGLRKQTDSMQKAIAEGLARQNATMQAGFAALREEMKAAVPPPVPVAAAVAPSPEPVATPQRISEDQLMILSAVLACHFGKRVKIRSARVITVGSGSNVWSQQGRAAVQASHSGLY
jgi:hypothetical protein